MKKIIMISGVMAAITYSATSYSFGFGDLAKHVPGADAISAAATKGSSESKSRMGVVPAFIIAAGSVNKAQIMLAKAFNLKEQATLLEAESNAFEKGATIESEQIETITAMQTATSELIAEKIASGAKLSSEGRILYAKSLVPYAVGLYGLNKLVDEAQSLIANPMSLMSQGGQVVAVAKEMPGYTETLFTTTKSVLTYAKSNDIEIPDEAAKNFAFL